MSWGKIELIKGIKNLTLRLKDIGPDLLRHEINKDEFIDIMRGKRLSEKPIDGVLLNQKIVSGIGNYLRADIMYQARINPKTLIKNLTDIELSDLYEDAIFLMNFSCNSGGHSLRDYFRLDGSKGNYVPIVYNQKKCPKLHKISTYKDSNKRTVFYCETCQPE
jgi:formamidopyrimidine-DNA glycosylase